MKVLIIDDSKVMRMIVRRTLREVGFGVDVVSEASNGDEALQVEGATHHDLILCDWNMPGMSGLELLRALRARGSATKFGFVTSETSNEMRDAAAEAGALFLIAKPFTPEDFEKALGSALLL